MARQFLDDSVVTIVRDIVQSEMGPFGLTRVSVAAAFTETAIAKLDAASRRDRKAFAVQLLLKRR